MPELGLPGHSVPARFNCTHARPARSPAWLTGACVPVSSFVRDMKDRWAEDVLIPQPTHELPASEAAPDSEADALRLPSLTRRAFLLQSISAALCDTPACLLHTPFAVMHQFWQTGLHMQLIAEMDSCLWHNSRLLVASS